MYQLNDQEVAKERGTLAVQMKCFLLFYSLLKRLSSAMGSHYGKSFASITGRIDDHVLEELCSDMLVVVSGGLQVDKNAGRNRRKIGH